MAELQEHERLRGKKALFVLGVGLGYQVTAIRERKDPRARVYAIERYEEVFHRAAQTQNWDLQAPDVEFWVGEDIDSVLQHLDEITADMDEADWDIITNRPSIRLDPEYYKRLIRERRPSARRRRGQRD
jgi:protein-L-isoaspartate O-methyltransferase